MQTVTNHTLKDILYYNDVPILTYEINYPHFHSNQAPDILDQINHSYEVAAQKLEAYVKNKLYPAAIEDYEFSQKNHFATRQYNAVLNYDISYLSDDLISLYFDQYIYTGGAHGATIRYADTWDLINEKKMKLEDFLPTSTTDYDQLIKRMKEHVIAQIQSNPSYYYPDYAKDVIDTFQEKDFYITPNGIVIFFQQYDIAPYSTGIPQFPFPFVNM